MTEKKIVKEFDYDIKNFITHNDYNSKTNQHDIALIELKRNVEFSELIRPACLGQKEKLESVEVIAVRLHRFYVHLNLFKKSLFLRLDGVRHQLKTLLMS